jgi:hypothetical protein
MVFRGYIIVYSEEKYKIEVFLFFTIGYVIFVALKMEPLATTFSTLYLNPDASLARKHVHVKDEDGVDVYRLMTPIYDGRDFMEDWYYDTMKKRCETYVNAEGYAHGTFKKWYPDGTPRAFASYTDGYLDGPFTVWHKNGVKAAEYTSTSAMDIGTGYYQGWDSRGCLIYSVKYDLNVLKEAWSSKKMTFPEQVVKTY